MPYNWNAVITVESDGLKTTIRPFWKDGIKWEAADQLYDTLEAAIDAAAWDHANRARTSTWPAT